MIKLAIALLCISFALIGMSIGQAPYKNGQTTFLSPASVEHGSSEQYGAARDAALTPKYAMQDYGVSLALVSIALAVFAKRVRMPAPGSMLGFTVLALLAGISTAAAFVFDLIQGMSREEFPPWADSIGIPLMGVPVLLTIGLVWAFAHLTLLRGVRRQRVSLSLSAWTRCGPWLRSISTLTASLIVLPLVVGEYWYAIPGLIWLYLYLALASVRTAATIDS